MSSLPSPDFFWCTLSPPRVSHTIVLHQKANKIALVKLFQQPIKTFRFPKTSVFSRKLNALKATSLGRPPKKFNKKLSCRCTQPTNKQEAREPWDLTWPPEAGLNFRKTSLFNLVYVIHTYINLLLP